VELYFDEGMMVLLPSGAVIIMIDFDRSLQLIQNSLVIFKITKSIVDEQVAY
jgi:hypothetical protein